MAAPHANRRSENVRFAALLVLLGACFLFGGASRTDVLSLIILQPLAVTCAAVFVLSPGPIRWESIKIPLLMLGMLSGIMAVQLVPLPPSIWLNLPGHSVFATPAQVAGLEQPWRPVSLTPDLTLSSLVALVVPLSALIGMASIAEERNARLLAFLLLAAALSAFVGLAQFAGGSASPFYFYSITNLGSPVGLFSNRNHQAVLLAMTPPMLTVWATLPAEPNVRTVRKWISIALAFFLIPMILATGSRAGLGLGALGIAASFMLWKRNSSRRRTSRWDKFYIPAIALTGLAMFALALVFSRDEALQRVIGVSLSEETRLNYFPALLNLASDFFPVGAGFGSFEPLYQFYEPFELLQPLYLNHAHNDLIELVIVGGLPALIVLVGFLVWLTLRAAKVLRSANSTQGSQYAQLGLVMVVTMLLSSLVDYPLRTPLLAAVFSLATAWISGYTGSRPRSVVQPGSEKNFTHSDHTNRATSRAAARARP